MSEMDTSRVALQRDQIFDKQPRSILKKKVQVSLAILDSGDPTSAQTVVGKKPGQRAVKFLEENFDKKKQQKKDCKEVESEQEWSRRTLTFKNNQHQAEFQKIVRRQARQTSAWFFAVVILINCGFTVLIFFVENEQISADLKHIAVTIGMPALLSVPLSILAQKQEALIELITLVFYLWFALSLVLVNSTEFLGPIDEQMRVQQTYYVGGIYIWSNMFLAATWLPGLVIRLTMNFIIMHSTVIFRASKGDQTSLALQPIYQIICIAFEIHLYLHVREKADLFCKLKTIEQQQRQLADLLDAVPDSVLICSRSEDDTASKGVYANRKMNQFFGREVVTKKVQKSLPTGPLQRPIPKQNPIHKRLFIRQSDYQKDVKGAQGMQVGQFFDEDCLDDRPMSLHDIVLLYQQRFKGGSQSSSSNVEQAPQNGLLRKFKQVFTVEAANPYKSESEAVQTVQVRIMDILFDNRVCSLVYLRDLTQLLHADTTLQTYKAVMDASQTFARERHQSTCNIKNLVKNMLNQTDSSVDFDPRPSLRELVNQTSHLKLKEKNLDFSTLLKTGQLRAGMQILSPQKALLKAQRNSFLVSSSIIQQADSKSAHINVLIDREIIQTVLQNILRQAKSLAKRNSQIILRFSVSRMEGDSEWDSDDEDRPNQELSFEVELEVDSASHDGFQALQKTTLNQDLSISLSAQLCDYLGGGLAFIRSGNSRNRLCFRVHFRCPAVKPDAGLANEKILIVQKGSFNFMDSTLSIVNQLGLKNRYLVVSNLKEAVSMIEYLASRDEIVSIIILDQNQESEPEKTFNRLMIKKPMLIVPKIVSLSIQYSDFEPQLRETASDDDQVAFKLAKPTTKEQFTRMLRHLNFNF